MRNSVPLKREQSQILYEAHKEEALKLRASSETFRAESDSYFNAALHRIEEYAATDGPGKGNKGTLIPKVFPSPHKNRKEWISDQKEFQVKGRSGYTIEQLYDGLFKAAWTARYEQGAPISGEQIGMARQIFDNLDMALDREFERKRGN